VNKESGGYEADVGGYEAVIALEVHVELATRTKAFCGCPTTFGAEPNTQVCQICLGHPGVLPALNRRAVEFAVRAALALDGQVHPQSMFARKNYFYPDLPKGYQITQYDRPLATGGSLNIEIGGEARRVRIRRLHLEEDTGKLLHGDGTCTLVDFNRAGVPLIEIVSEPDCRAPAEAAAYLEALRSVLEYLGVSDVRMEEGSMRCEPNISLRPVGADALGTPVEIKNLNSFRSVERALVYEIDRQTALLRAGRPVDRETRRWDEASGTTKFMRRKEGADDYRYFPEPDLPPLTLATDWVEAIRRCLPELAMARRNRFVQEYGLPSYDAGILTASRHLADYFEEAVALLKSGEDIPGSGKRPAGGEGASGATSFSGAKMVCNWLMGDVSRLLNEAGLQVSAIRARSFNLPPVSLAEIVALVFEGTISGKMAKDILEESFACGKSPKSIVAEKGLSQISDAGALEAVVAQVLESNPSVVADFLAGREKALGFLIGQVMKATGGKANPQMVNEMISRLRRLPPHSAGAGCGCG
jgi:aspartyl-tRNA(Asn)/glutamyl-tRNA(Gln) amidotransferase subunit B